MVGMRSRTRSLMSWDSLPRIRPGTSTVRISRSMAARRAGLKPSEEISMPQVILKRFETPDEVISFEKDRFEKITLGGVTIGRAVYEPGWKWSTHIGSKSGATLCQVEHVG